MHDVSRLCAETTRKLRTVAIPILRSVFNSRSFLTNKILRMKAFSQAYSLILYTSVVSLNSSWMCHFGKTYLLMFARSSLINFVRLSLFFICSCCIFLRIRAMKVFKGIENTMMPTPTKAGHPKMLYNEMKARAIYRPEASGLVSILGGVAIRTWKGPEMAMSPYAQKSCRRVASTDIKLTMSPDPLPLPSFESTSAF